MILIDKNNNKAHIFFFLRLFFLCTGVTSKRRKKGRASIYHHELKRSRRVFNGLDREKKITKKKKKNAKDVSS